MGSTYKKVRGGSWVSYQGSTRAIYRGDNVSSDRSDYYGFRVLEDPKTNPQTRKMIRGGCWSFDADASRSAYRLRWPRPADRSSYVGFRLLEDHPKS